MVAHATTQQIGYGLLSRAHTKRTLPHQKLRLILFSSNLNMKKRRKTTMKQQSISSNNNRKEMPQKKNERLWIPYEINWMILCIVCRCANESEQTHSHIYD